MTTDNKELVEKARDYLVTRGQFMDRREVMWIEDLADALDGELKRRDALADEAKALIRLGGPDMGPTIDLSREEIADHLREMADNIQSGQMTVFKKSALLFG